MTLEASVFSSVMEAVQPVVYTPIQVSIRASSRYDPYFAIDEYIWNSVWESLYVLDRVMVHKANEQL
jgi:hypothetical protein